MSSTGEQMNIYELSMEFQKLQETENEEDMQLELDKLQCALSEKMEGYYKVIKNLESTYNGLQVEINHLMSKKRAIEGKIARLKENIAFACISTGKDKIEHKYGYFRLMPPRMSLIIDAEVPESYLEVQYIVDKSKIEKALQEGNDLPFARYTVGKPYIMMK